MLEINKIYNMDCMVGMKEIADKSVDCIICDPPFGTTANQWDSILPFDELWKEYKRILKPKGNILIFCNNVFMFQLYNSNPKMYRYDLVWQKSKCGSPLTAKYMPLKKHENILVFGESAAKYNPQMVEGEPYHRHYTPNKKNNMQYGIEGVETNNEGTRHPSTILDFPQKWRRQDQMHPTQKPVELIQWLIRSYSDKGDLILDNCMGSGTTAVAAIKEGRNFIGFELNEEYYKIACERIDAAEPEQNASDKVMEKESLF